MKEKETGKNSADITLIGCGCGAESLLTAEAEEALAGAEVLIGGKRLIDGLPARFTGCRITAAPPEFAARIQEQEGRKIAVLFSGDTGFFSGAKMLRHSLDAEGVSYRVLPGIASPVYLASRLGISWQDIALVSAHGRSCDPVRALQTGKPTFFLTGGEATPSAICRRLAEAGLGEQKVLVAERLSYPDEKITKGTASELAAKSFDPLCVLLVAAVPVYARGAAGIPDAEFLRKEGVPMTKREVRASICALLNPREGDVIWDIGAGTGSVGIELSRYAARVYAVEKNAAALAALAANRRKFCAWNLTAVEGEAPDVLPALPKPDRVFIGGSGGRLREILEALDLLPQKPLLCLTAVTLETLSAVTKWLSKKDFEAEILSLAVSRAVPAGDKHLLKAENPVFLVKGSPR